MSTKKPTIKQQLTELEDKYQRALADYQNLVKQTAKEKQEFAKYATEALIGELVPVIDNLEQAAGHLQDQGLEMVVKQFQQFLQSEGVEVINPQPGDKFDHTLHECLEIVGDKDKPEDTLAEITLKGYKYTSGRVIRPAKVKVYKGKG
jgi:molecular chaperone GrpE